MATDLEKITQELKAIFESARRKHLPQGKGYNENSCPHLILSDIFFGFFIHFLPPAILVVLLRLASLALPPIVDNIHLSHTQYPRSTLNNFCLVLRG